MTDVNKILVMCRDTAKSIALNLAAIPIDYNLKWRNKTSWLVQETI
jgi:hypothetical protein